MAVKFYYMLLLLAFDLVTFLLTLYYTVVQYRFIVKHGVGRLSKLFMAIVEGAVMYFGVLLVCYIVSVTGILTWRVRTTTWSRGVEL